MVYEVGHCLVYANEPKQLMTLQGIDSDLATALVSMESSCGPACAGAMEMGYDSLRSHPQAY